MLRLFPFFLLLAACHSLPEVRKDRINKIQRIVILGNSIVQQPAAPATGWRNNWGMAATTQEKDFVHLLIRDLRRVGTGVIVQFRNIAAFERNYRTYDLSGLDSFRGADLYIFKLCENVPDPADDYTIYYKRLIDHLNKPESINIIVDGFWGRKLNRVLRSFAASNGYPFIRNSDLSDDKANMSLDQFRDHAVGLHPSDQGMQKIESRIWDYVKEYFKPLPAGQ